MKSDDDVWSPPREAFIDGVWLPVSDQQMIDEIVAGRLRGRRSAYGGWQLHVESCQILREKVAIAKARTELARLFLNSVQTDATGRPLPSENTAEFNKRFYASVDGAMRIQFPGASDSELGIKGGR